MKSTLLSLLAAAAFAQPPQNLDFENGDLTNWKSLIRENGEWLYTEPLPNRHEVVTGIDDNWIGGVQTVEQYSAKVGNDTPGQAEAIEYYVESDNDSFLLYHYSAVLDDPWHWDAERPRLEVSLTANGKLLHECHLQRIEMTDSLGPLETQVINNRKIRFSERRAGILDPGQPGNFTLRFATFDCGLGGHFGYAYLDAALLPKIQTVPFCTSDPIELSAPHGFRSYHWSTGETTASVRVKPQDGTTYKCEVVPDFGCPAILFFQLVKSGPEECRQMMHFFTPNADGYNDRWNPPWEKGDQRCLITNRNGMIVKLLLPQESWDGQIDNQPAPQDDYWFQLISSGNVRTGHFALKR